MDTVRSVRSVSSSTPQKKGRIVCSGSSYHLPIPSSNPRTMARYNSATAVTSLPSKPQDPAKALHESRSFRPACSPKATRSSSFHPIKPVPNSNSTSSHHGGKIPRGRNIKEEYIPLFCLVVVICECRLGMLHDRDELGHSWPRGVSLGPSWKGPAATS